MLNIRHNLCYSTLVIDEDKYYREILARICWEKFASNVIEAEDGCQGIEILSTNLKAVHVIILGMKLTRLNPYEVMNIVRSRYTSNHLKIIAASAKGDKDTRRMAFEFGADAFINKQNDSFKTITQILSDFY